VAVSVGQRVFFDKPIIIEPGIVLIIRGKRKRQEGQKGGQKDAQKDGRKDGADNDTDDVDAG
jgi:hypothetical protein